MRWTGSRPKRDVPFYVDTPAGLLAADGTHYHTTEPLLRDYAEPVVEAVGLESLLRQAGVWLRSPQALAILFLPALLVVMPWWAALGTALLLYALGSAGAPGVVVPALVGPLRVLEHPVTQGLVYVGVLSAFAAQGRIDAVWTGVAGFVAFRLGLVGRVLQPIVQATQQALYPLPAPDQTLRSLIVREALRRGITLDGMDTIEARVRAFWRKGEDG